VPVVGRGSLGSAQQQQQPPLSTQDSGRLEKSGPSSRFGRPSSASVQVCKTSYLDSVIMVAAMFGCSRSSVLAAHI
jgi:hypothetical protein